MQSMKPRAGLFWAQDSVWPYGSCAQEASLGCWTRRNTFVLQFSNRCFYSPQKVLSGFWHSQCFSYGKVWHIFDWQSPPLKDDNDHFIREGGAVSKKNVSLVLLGAVNVTAHRKEMFLGPGLINQSGSLRWRHFISVSETCWVASGLQERLRNGFPGKEQTGDITRESLVFLDAALGQS